MCRCDGKHEDCGTSLNGQAPSPAAVLQGNILPDGSEAGDAAQWLRRHRAETELAAAEEAVRCSAPVSCHATLFSACVAKRRTVRTTAVLSVGHRLLQGADKRLRAAERRLDAVLEAALGGDDGFAGVDDFDLLEQEQEGQGAAATAAAASAAAGDPDSFSRVDLSLPESQLRAAFPDFPVRMHIKVSVGRRVGRADAGARACTLMVAAAPPLGDKCECRSCWLLCGLQGVASALVAEVEAGQMLYIPAGWFHEVTSYAASGSASPTHLALNFWYHPPNNLRRHGSGGGGGSGPSTWEQPYR